MAYLLQIDFKMDGPFGEEMAEKFLNLAFSINEVDGLMWKIWTESWETKEAGGIYLFETKETADHYLNMHAKRLADFGIKEINSKIFIVNTKLTEINKGPVSKY